MSPHRTLRVNILRNLRDQPLHILWAFASIFAPFLAGSLGAPRIVVLVVALLGVASVVWIVVREAKQFPPHDWWDAPLDWAMYVVGGIGGLVWGLLL